VLLSSSYLEKANYYHLAGRDASAKDRYIAGSVEMQILFPDHYLRSQIHSIAGHEFASRCGFSGKTLINEHDGADMLNIYRDECAQLMLLLLLRTDTGSPLTLRDSNSGTTLEFSGVGGFPIFVDLDKTTHLPYRLRKQEQIHMASGGDGPIINLIMSVDDWRDVNGLRLPHHLSYTEGGTVTIDIRFQSIEINPCLSGCHLTLVFRRVFAARAP